MPPPLRSHRGRELLRSRRFRVLAASGAAVLLGAAVAWLILTNAYPDEGPFLSISATHGVHVGDAVLVSVWALITLALARWAVAGRPRRRGDPLEER